MNSCNSYKSIVYGDTYMHLALGGDQLIPLEWMNDLNHRDDIVVRKHLWFPQDGQQRASLDIDKTHH